MKPKQNTLEPQSKHATSTEKHRRQLITKIAIAGLWGLAAILVVILMFIAGVSGFAADKIVGAVIYDLLVLIPLIIIGVLHTIHCRRTNQNPKSNIVVWSILGGLWIMTVWFANYESGDWIGTLSQWCQSYQSKNFTDALQSITSVSDYTPFYNYWLVIFSQIFTLQGCLYAIKYLTFVFSIALAVAMELIISEIRQTKFNYLHLVSFLLLPPVLMEFTAWGQCDAIYTTFCLFAFYWALKHRSVPCFINLGLAFTIKLQFLFIVPIIFIMLLIRDTDGKKYLSWKWVWLAPLMYVVNLVPLFAGTPLIDLLKVYFKQAGSYMRFSMNCANLSYVFNDLIRFMSQRLFYVITLVFAAVGITMTILLLVLVLRAHRRQTLTTTDLVRYALCFALVMVYFMPKMHERFYFVAMALVCVYGLTQPSQRNTLIATLVTMALTLPMFACLILDYPLVLYKITVYCGLIMNTIALVMLLYPLIRAEIATHRHPKAVSAEPVAVESNAQFD